MSRKQQLINYARLLQLRGSVLERERSSALRDAAEMGRQIEGLQARNDATRRDIDAMHSLDGERQDKGPRIAGMEMRMHVAAGYRARLEDAQAEVEAIETRRLDAGQRADSASRKLDVMQRKMESLEAKVAAQKARHLLAVELREEDDLPPRRS